MALSAITPRDRVQRLGDLARKTLRYWWLVGVFAVVGGGLSFAFAMTKSKSYQSWSTLFYQEQIQSQFLSSNREEVAQRNIGDKYRELLTARPQLEQIINDDKLNPFPDLPDQEMAIERLRAAVKLEVRGIALRIVYSDADPDRARLVVEKLTKLLQDKDEKMRNDQAHKTVEFLTTQKEGAAKELRQHEKALATFLAAHPEFAQDTQAGQEGASIRAVRDQKKIAIATGNPRLYALERQRQRIQARLDAPPDAPAIRVASPPSPERVAAEAQVAVANRELEAANRELDDAKSKFTDLHPTVIKAQDRVVQATTRLRHAQGAVPQDVENVVAPATAEDRVKLTAELHRLDSQIADAQRGVKPVATAATKPGDSGPDWVVELETGHANLRRAVSEQRQRVNSLSDSVFRAEIDASQKLAETGGRLDVIDPAFKPARPSGPGKSIFLAAGMVLFLSLGLALAIGLAVIDDRLYHRGDIDQLGIAVLGVIPPLRYKKPRKEAT